MRPATLSCSPPLRFQTTCARKRRAQAVACLGLWLGICVLEPILLPLRAANPAAKNLFEFRGQVTMPPRTISHRVRRIFVALFGVTTPFSGRTWADPNGRFRLRNLPPATYSLSIYIPGVGEVRQTVEITQSFADPKGRVEKKFVFDEQALRVQARPVQSGVVSVRELSIPEKARREFGKAQSRLRSRDVEGAIRRLKRAVELAPQFVEAVNNLGIIYYQKQDYSTAEGHFRNALEADPEAFEPLVNLGGVLLAIGGASEAMEINQRAQAARPLDALANAQLGLSYFRLGDFEHAVQYLQQTKHLDPGHFTNPQIALARIYLRRSREKEALQELQDFLEQHPDSPEADNVRATIERIQQSQASPADERLPL